MPTTPTYQGAHSDQFFVTPARARSCRTVFEGWAPFLSHAAAFSLSISILGGSVRGL